MRNLANETSDDVDNGVLAGTDRRETTGIGIVDGSTAQVEVVLPALHDDDADDDVDDADFAVVAVTAESIEDAGLPELITPEMSISAVWLPGSVSCLPSQPMPMNSSANR